MTNRKDDVIVEHGWYLKQNCTANYILFLGIKDCIERAIPYAG